MTRRRLLYLGALALVLVAGAALVLWPRGTTEISEQQALDDFREQEAARPAADADGAHDAVAATPPPGVYTYRAEGQEEVKLGPLPTQTRPLPDTVTAVSVDAGSGCFDWTLNLFAEHVEETTFCSDGADLRLDRHTKHQQIGAVSPTATMTCDPDVVVSSDGSAAEPRCELTLSGGPMSVTAALAGRSTPGRAETLAIDGVEVATTPVTIRYEVTGDLSGTWTETVWWSPDHLAVRIERDLELEGPATFTERSRLELVALEPAR